MMADPFSVLSICGTICVIAIAVCITVNEIHTRRVRERCQHEWVDVRSTSSGRIVGTICRKCGAKISVSQDF